MVTDKTKIIYNLQKQKSFIICWWLRVDFEANNMLEISDMWLQCINAPTMR